MAYRQYIKVGKRKYVPLNRTFKTKAQAQKFTRERNKRFIKYVIGGRGFRTKSEAQKWRNQRIANPPLYSSSEQMRKVLKIKKQKAPKLSFRKER